MGALQKQTPDGDKSNLLASSARLVRLPRVAGILGSANIMDNQSVSLHESEEEVLICRVPDEALEAAAAILKERVGSFTLSFCSGRSGQRS